MEHNEDVVADNGAEGGGTIGQELRATREAQGLELEQVAAQTRIPLRHLESIESDDFTGLPSRTYAIGFTRTYARLLGLDERPVLDRVRDQLAQSDNRPDRNAARYEPGDPARIPGRGLAWFGLIAAILFAGGLFAFYRSYLAPGMGPAPLTEPSLAAASTAAPGAATAAATATPQPSGPVVFTSLMDDTWVKFYDGSGERLYEAQMPKGGTYQLPADAQNPQLWTGRPYALAITIGGRSVPKISEDDTVVKDVPVSAEALLARAPASGSTGTPAGAATPAAQAATATPPAT